MSLYHQLPQQLILYLQQPRLIHIQPSNIYLKWPKILHFNIFKSGHLLQEGCVMWDMLISVKVKLILVIISSMLTLALLIVIFSKELSNFVWMATAHQLSIFQQYLLQSLQLEPFVMTWSLNKILYLQSHHQDLNI